MAGSLYLPYRLYLRQFINLRNFGSHAGLVEVCILDPREALQGASHSADLPSAGDKEDSHPALANALRLKLPSSFLPELSKGVFELGDTDEPMNHWRFGKPAEIFELDYVGKCTIASGIVGVIGVKDLVSTAQSWKQLQELVDNGKDGSPTELSPFLFAGRVVQSDTVSIYMYHEGGEVKGLQITSDAEELD